MDERSRPIHYFRSCKSASQYCCIYHKSPYSRTKEREIVVVYMRFLFFIFSLFNHSLKHYSHKIILFFITLSLSLLCLSKICKVIKVKHYVTTIYVTFQHHLVFLPPSTEKEPVYFCPLSLHLTTTLQHLSNMLPCCMFLHLLYKIDI